MLDRSFGAEVLKPEVLKSLRPKFILTTCGLKRSGAGRVQQTMARHATRSVSQQACRTAIRCHLVMQALQQGLPKALEHALATAVRIKQPR